MYMELVLLCWTRLISKSSTQHEENLGVTCKAHQVREYKTQVVIEVEAKKKPEENLIV